MNIWNGTLVALGWRSKIMPDIARPIAHQSSSADTPRARMAAAQDKVRQTYRARALPASDLPEVIAPSSTVQRVKRKLGW